MSSTWTAHFCQAEYSVLRFSSDENTDSDTLDLSTSNRRSRPLGAGVHLMMLSDRGLSKQDAHCCHAVRLGICWLARSLLGMRGRA